jgi:phosphohistidine phosphatase
MHGLEDPERVKGAESSDLSLSRVLAPALDRGAIRGRPNKGNQTRPFRALTGHGGFISKPIRRTLCEGKSGFGGKGPTRQVMRIYLVQHGEAKSEQEDSRRTLTEKGIGEVQKVAEFLRPLAPAVDTVWHSGKARAQQTAELLAQALGAQDRVVVREGLGPKDPVAATKEALEHTGGDVMIVGHLPFLGKLVALLVTGREELEMVEFQYGSVVCLERRDGGSWKVGWMITPGLLQR